MELPKTTQGNKYMLVFQDFLMKWPMVYPSLTGSHSRLQKY